MRLIDAEGSYTLNECNETGHSLAFGGGFIDVYDPEGKYICQFWAGDAPTVDAVPVIRCKDCENFADAKGKDSGKHCGYGQCKFPVGIRGIVCADDFCSFGKRKDGDGNDA